MTDEYTNDNDQYTDKPKQDLGTKGVKDQVAGKAKEVAGKVQSGVGNVTSDEFVEGKRQGQTGRGQSAADRWQG